MIHRRTYVYEVTNIISNVLGSILRTSEFSSEQTKLRFNELLDQLDELNDNVLTIWFIGIFARLYVGICIFLN